MPAILNADTIKERLFAPQLEPLLRSDLVYAYQELVTSIIEVHDALAINPLTAPFADLCLPIAASSVMPTSLSSSRMNLAAAIHQHSKAFSPQPELQQLRLINPLPSEDDFLAQLAFFRHHTASWKQLTDSIQEHLNLQTKLELVHAMFNDPLPIPELDFMVYTFETWEPWTTIETLKANGYTVLLTDVVTTWGQHTPEAILNADIHGDFIRCVKRQLNMATELEKINRVTATLLIPQNMYQHLLCRVSVNNIPRLPKNIQDDLWECIRKAHPTIYQGIMKKIM